MATATNLVTAHSNPEMDRSEWQLFIDHPKVGTSGTAYFLGSGIETMDYTIAVESTEKKTIAQSKPAVTNKDGGITLPAEFELSAGNPLYDALLSVGLLGKVNEEFNGLFVYGNIDVKENSSVVADAFFAQAAAMKFTVSKIGGAGTEKIKITTEGKTTGNIRRGVVELGTDGANYDAEEATWKMTAFREIPTLDIGDLVVVGA